MTVFDNVCAKFKDPHDLYPHTRNLDYAYHRNPSDISPEGHGTCFHLP